MSLRFCFCVLIIACSTEQTPNPDSREAHVLERKNASLTVDLSDDWTPYLFSESDDSSPPLRNAFRDAYLASANEQPFASPLEIAADKAALERTAPKRREHFPSDASIPKVHRYLEVFGIPPTFSVLRDRALKEVDRACYREVDRAKLSAFDGFVAYTNNRDAKRRANDAKALSKVLKAEMSTKGFATLGEYRTHAGDDEKRKAVDSVLEYEALIEAQRELMCEGLFEREDGEMIEGGLGYATHLALLRFEQKNRIFGWGYLSKETLTSLRKSPTERLYEALVRVVNERVADAAGIIEDGSAKVNGTPETYRTGDFEIRSVRDLVGETTQSVLDKLGIASPDDGVVFLRSSAPTSFRRRWVKLDVPPLPPYYGDEMKLSITIDRGDVYYDYPYEQGVKTLQRRLEAPTLTLTVRYNRQDIPLVRMNTSIGGWQEETAEDGYVYVKYKNTEVGEGIIREIIAAPTWVPPESTPSKDILKTVTVRNRAVTLPNGDLVGPWFTSAYGLVAAVHLKKASSGRYVDEGIRSHGSYDYTSVSKRHSHGCHRLINHLSIRLYDFVLRHTPHRRIGQRAAKDVRRFSFNKTSYKIEVTTDGYVFELLKPIPVETLKGTILGNHKSPIPGYMPKPNIRYGADALYVK